MIMDKVFGRYAIIVRYLTSGGTAFGANIVVLYVLTEYVGVYYLFSVVLAFLFGLIVSFLMMKHWTFQDGSYEEVNRQAAVYFGIALFNLVLNTTLVYLLVEAVHVWYVFSQVMSSLLIAISSFFIYKHLIFVKKF